MQGLLGSVRVLDPLVDKHANRIDTSSTYRSHSFQIVSFMQNKGGVCKTTCSYTAAYGLAKAGQRVLYVDADGQRNGEETALSRHIHEHFDGDSEEFYEQADCHDTMLTALKRATEGEGRLRAPKVLELNLDVLEGQPQGSHAGRLLVLPGDDVMADWDTALSQSKLLMSMPMQGMNANVPGLFYHLMQMTAYIYNIEFVVVDMSPNCGAFNQNILTSSNAFFMPATIDPKCRQAIKKFGRNFLELWLLEWRDVRKRALLLKCQYPMPDIIPKFLGVIFSRVGYPGAIRPYASYHELGKIHNVISQELMPTVQRLGMALPAARYAQLRMAAVRPDGAPAPVDGVVAYIIDYHRLELMALQASVPVPYIGRQHMWAFKSDVWKQWLEAHQNNLQLQPPIDAEIHQPVSGQELDKMLQKVQSIRSDCNRIVALVQALPV